MPDDHRQLAEAYLAMLNQHDPDAVDRFVAVDYINHNPFVPDGREANRAFWAGFFAAFPDLQATMEDLVVARKAASQARPSTCAWSRPR